MAKFMNYNREKAVNYATKWALSRNPRYKDYEEWGGDCTNFISQCIRAGNIPLDHEGNDVLKNWYWYSDTNRTPSWTASQPFYKYLTLNNSSDTKNFGVYAVETEFNRLEKGDLVQLVYENNLAYHTMIISEVILEDDMLVDYLVCQHTYDLLNYPLSLKEGIKRYIKIIGYYD